MTPVKYFLRGLHNPRRLATKLALELAVAAALGLCASLLFTSVIVSGLFGTMEQQEIQTNIARLQTNLADQKQSVKARSLDWSTWDDAYDFLADGNREFIQDNLEAASVVNLDVNSIGYVRFDGTINFTRYVDLQSKEEDVETAEALERYVGTNGITQRARQDPQFQTYVRLNDKLLALAFSHVVKSDGTGKPLGFAVIGREIKANAVAQKLQLPVNEDLFAIATSIQTDLRNDVANISIPVTDYDMRPVATIRFGMARNVRAAGINMLLIVGVGISALLFAMVGFINWRLRKTVVNPLVDIEDHVRLIAQTKQLLSLPESFRRDEIGSLSSGLNEMTGQLIELRAEVEDQSFELGKNQSAIGVMHNIRNGLAPVYTILSRMHQQVHPQHQENALRAINELHDGQLSAERRRKLADFLSATHLQYDSQLGTCRTDAREAGRCLATVLEAISQAQAVDGASPDLSDCNVVEIIGSACSSAKHLKFGEIEIDYHPEAKTQMLRVNRVLLSQIIVNLLTNAVESVAEQRCEDGLVRIRQSVIAADSHKTLQIMITDNGEGFDSSLENRMFERGYSTRAGKTGGLGLHWCANTVNAMGGTLGLKSAGKGQGATATLSFPIAA